MSLDLLGEYIARKKHLPNMPSTEEIKKDGLNLSQFQMKLLEKIEELILYTLRQEAIIQAERVKIEDLEDKLQQLTKGG